MNIDLAACVRTSFRVLWLLPKRRRQSDRRGMLYRDESCIGCINVSRYIPVYRGVSRCIAVSGYKGRGTGIVCCIGVYTTLIHAIHAFLIQRVIHLLYIFFTDCRYIYSRERHLRQSRTHQSVHLFVQLQQGKLGRAACRLGPRPHTP